MERNGEEQRRGKRLVTLTETTGFWFRLAPQRMSAKKKKSRKKAATKPRP
jgi:hypothetical protein